MKLVFQPRSDGFRVVRMDNGTENMLASLKTKRPILNSERRTVKKFDENTGKPYDKVIENSPITEYVPLPRGECSIHSAVGELSIADLEEMIAHLKDQPTDCPVPEVEESKPVTSLNPE